jgi:purine-binding chemotaxis protein CheW
MKDSQNSFTRPSHGTRNFDWEKARQRIATAQAALAAMDADATNPEVLQQVWARRAAQLAQEPTREDPGERLELVLVRLGRELYGLDAQYVFDIRPVEQITRVPRVPPWVAGVINLRGRILSVIDLRGFFGLAPAEQEEAGEKGFLVVVETPEMEVALLVDEALSVEALPASQMQEVDGVIRGLRPEYVRSVAERRNGDATQVEPTNGTSTMLVILDLPALLADKDLIIHKEVA